MRPPNPRIIVYVCLFAVVACLLPILAREEGADEEPVGDRSPFDELQAVAERLRPLHTEMGPVQPGDWLSMHRERHRSFADYVAAGPTDAHGVRKVVYILPIGEFSEDHRAIVDTCAEFMHRFFELRTVILETLPVGADWPEEAQRVHPEWGDRQLLSTYILDDVLGPRLPEDAAVLLGFTARDLWPGDGWNFVFGQASLRGRVGVWSIYRNGDPTTGDEGFRRCLLRTLKTAVHETGHMFSITHCVKYECGMCGSNNRRESDRRPLAFCPDCVAKTCWATGADPMRRFEQLAAFCGQHGLVEDQRFFAGSAKALE